MRYKPITLFGRHFRIVPSLENMCNLEEKTKVNLISGVDPSSVDLRFMRCTIENLVEDEQGNHLSSELLEKLYQSSADYASQVFLECYAQMYHLPKSEEKAVKKLIRRSEHCRKCVKDGWHPGTL